MTTPQKHPLEEQRLAALKALDILPTRASPEFDAFPRMAAKLLGAPQAAFTLVDRNSLWFKATAGFAPAELSVPRFQTMCHHTILQRDPLVIPDTLADPRTATSPLVTRAGGLRSYAGMAVLDPRGLPLGALCVFDGEARDFTPAQVAELRTLALDVEAVVALHAARLADSRQRSWHVMPAAKAATAKAAARSPNEATALPPIAEKGLNAAGIMLGIVGNPELGERASFDYGNQALAELLGTNAGRMAGHRMADVAARISQDAARAALLGAMRSGEAARIDMPFRTADGERWLGANVTFPDDGEGGPRRMLLIGRDITSAMTNLSREQKSKLLMTSMFTQVDVPVALVSRAGRIAMANTAFRAMVDLPPEEVDGRLFNDLVNREDLRATMADEERQHQDGVTYRRRTRIRTREGRVADVLLTSAVLTFEGQRYRTVTLNPTGSAAGDAMMTREFKLTAERGAGEFRPLGIAAIRTAAGDRWPRIALAAMQSAERVIRRRLGPNDVVTRLDDDTFAIWFDGISRIRNDEALATITRDVRLRLMIDFAKEIAPGRDAPQDLAMAD